MPVHHEVEATLVVAAYDPRSIVTKIEQLTWVCEYRLLPQPSQQIHDTYFDTPQGLLRSRRFALRARKVEGKCLLTLKGQAKRLSPTVARRLEIEEPWSVAALAAVRKTLADHGIELRFDTDRDCGDTWRTLQAAGLAIVQERTTLRRLRQVATAGLGGPRVAELAIDSVTYRFRDQVARHHELEVELKGKQDPAILQPIVAELCSASDGALRTWPHSKLVTGTAIEHLVEEGSIDKLLDTEGNLKPDAYTVIDARVFSSGA